VKILFSAHDGVTSQKETLRHVGVYTPSLFVPEFLNDDEEVDWDRWEEYVRAGRRWFQDEALEVGPSVVPRRPRGR